MATVAELVQHLQGSVLRDVVAPTLWSTDELVRYLSEAEVIFARRTHCLVTEEGALAQLQIEAGKSKYPLPKQVVHVYEVVNEVGRPLHELSRARSGVTRALGPSPPRAYALGRGSNQITVYPVPDDSYEFTMLVAHTPEKLLATCPVTGYRVPEIPEEYHLSLCQYAAYKALLNNDPEGSNTVAAGDFLVGWEQSLREAKRDVFRLRTPAGAAVRNNWTASRRG